MVRAWAHGGRCRSCRDGLAGGLFGSAGVDPCASDLIVPVLARSQGGGIFHGAVLKQIHLQRSPAATGWTQATNSPAQLHRLLVCCVVAGGWASLRKQHEACQGSRRARQQLPLAVLAAGRDLGVLTARGRSFRTAECAGWGATLRHSGHCRLGCHCLGLTARLIGKVLGSAPGGASGVESVSASIPVSRSSATG